MTRSVELRRHTDNDGDRLSDAGVEAALAVARELAGRYHLVVSSGAQRATQTAACFLAGGVTAERGVVVDERFRSGDEDRWRAIYGEHRPADVAGFRDAAPEFVDAEAQRFATALRDVFEALPDGGRALVVGHSPMHEAAVYGLTGEVIAPLGKGEGVVVTRNGDAYRVEPA